MVGQRLGGPIFTRGDKVPDEALDVLIATVMEQTVGEEGSADRFHISLLHGAFKTPVSQDVVPPSPPKDEETDHLVSTCTRPSPNSAKARRLWTRATAVLDSTLISVHAFL